MEYRTDNTQSIWFFLRRVVHSVLYPFEQIAEFLRSARDDIRMSEREDFDPFMHRTFDPERNQSIFA